MDIFDRIKKDKGPLGNHYSSGDGYYMFPKLEGELAPEMTFQGKKVLNWSINNYLGLGNHPEVREADAKATADYGLAYPMGSRMMSGNSDKHDELEQELANFIDKEAVILLNFGYQGVLSCIDALCTRKDVIVYDSECHACIIDGVRLHMGKRFVYPHNDIKSLEKQLQRATKMVEETGGGILVITEGVFGMTGNMGRLKETCDLKEKYDFRLLVDDAHGFGTMGNTGAGTGEQQGVQDKIDLYFSTFAKSMAAIGAFVGGDKEIVDFLRCNMRSQIFAKSLPMPFVVGALKRLEMLRDQPEHKANLWTVVNNLQSGLRDAGFEIGTTESAVTPVYMKGGIEDALGLTHDLRENHRIFCSIVIYPVVPKDVILLRLIPTAAHTVEHVERTLKAFKSVTARLLSGEYKQEFGKLVSNKS